MFHIFIISDGTGQTAEFALKAALTQYSKTEVIIERFSEVRSREPILDIIEKAACVNAFVVHTLVSRELRNYILQISKLHNVETTDLMGPLLAQLSERFDYSPSEKPGLFRELNKAYFQRIEAMEFVLRHDDGQRPRELDKAELVLVGVSRTFKTPLSIYFAFRGWMVANVPIILNMEPPEILFKLPPGRVFALTTDARNLSALRKVRHVHLGGATGEYADINHVRKELIYANELFCRRPDWPVIKVTHKPIEEIASEIMEILKNKQKTENSAGTSMI